MRSRLPSVSVTIRSPLSRLGGERHHFPVRRCVEVLLHQDFVDAGVLQSARPVARRDERAHQAHRHARVQWILRREPAPPAHRLRRITPVRRSPRQLLERLGVAMRQPHPLLLGPAVELRRARQMKAVQKCPGVVPHRRIEPARAQRLAELGHVARHQVGVEAEVPTPDEHLVVAQILAQRVERLAETPPGAIVLGVRPEIGQHFLACQSRLARRGEEREDGEPARLGGRAAHDAVGAAHVQPAEGMNAQHVASGDSEGMRA